MKKLYQLSKGSKIYDLTPNGDKNGVVVFDHVDGMYSYCYIQGKPDEGVVHLGATTVVEEHKDGWRLYDYKPSDAPR